jgi:thiamine biosynthesis lipoprotein
LVKIILLLLALLTFDLSQAQSLLSNHRETLILMGTKFEITAVADSKAIATNAVSKGIEEIERIESLISSWQPTSQTSEINRNAGIQEVLVDKELFDLIERALKVSALTDGAFDISFAGVYQLYQFDRAEHELPSTEFLKEATSKIDFNKIILNREKHSVFLAEEGMKIGFGAIGKGFAANKARQAMMAVTGVKGGIVNASGDLVIWGENGSEEAWPIQISDPKDIDKTIGTLHIRNASVVTSGDYEKYFTNNGKRYAHIIDPASGLPTTGIKSVTVVCPDGELGDALATSVFVLGTEKGIALINKLKNTEALIITDQDEVLTSNNLDFTKENNQ